MRAHIRYWTKQPNPSGPDSAWHEYDVGHHEMVELFERRGKYSKVLRHDIAEHGEESEWELIKKALHKAGFNLDGTTYGGN